MFLAVSGCFWLLLVVSGCLWLLVAVFGCFWLLLAVSGCFWMLLAASGCFWLLLAASGSFWLLLAAAGSLWLLLAATIDLLFKWSQPWGWPYPGEKMAQSGRFYKRNCNWINSWLLAVSGCYWLPQLICLLNGASRGGDPIPEQK